MILTFDIRLALFTYLAKCINQLLRSQAIIVSEKKKFSFFSIQKSRSHNLSIM